MTSEHLFHHKLSALTSSEDVLTEIQQMVGVGYLVIWELIEERTHVPTQKIGYHQHYSCIQANDAVGRRREHRHTLQCTQHVMKDPQNPMNNPAENACSVKHELLYIQYVLYVYSTIYWPPLKPIREECYTELHQK